MVKNMPGQVRIEVFENCRVIQTKAEIGCQNLGLISKEKSLLNCETNQNSKSMYKSLKNTERV
jgi:hypothetical protein